MESRASSASARICSRAAGGTPPTLESQPLLAMFSSTAARTTCSCALGGGEKHPAALRHDAREAVPWRRAAPYHVARAPWGGKKEKKEEKKTSCCSSTRRSDCQGLRSASRGSASGGAGDLSSASLLGGLLVEACGTNQMPGGCQATSSGWLRMAHSRALCLMIL